MYYRLLDACRAEGCPVCRVEQQSTERYLENQFYENVNSPKWRDRLRGSQGFCHVHAWLAVDQRLGDPLGFSIIYRDLLNNILRRLKEGNESKHSYHRRTSLLRRVPEQARGGMERILTAITPTKSCPVCEHRNETAGMLVTVMMQGLGNTEMVDALQSSEGVCLPHLQLCLESAKDTAACGKLLEIQIEKMEGLRSDLEEFIRKSDYQVDESFGGEGDAWLRAVMLVVGQRKGK